MKKDYIIPNMQVVILGQLQPLAGSNDGPSGDSQSDPNIGGSGGSSRRRRRIEWDYDEEEEDF